MTVVSRSTHYVLEVSTALGEAALLVVVEVPSFVCERAPLVLQDLLLASPPNSLVQKLGHIENDVV
jgi:hypothetical protein